MDDDRLPNDLFFDDAVVGAVVHLGPGEELEEPFFVQEGDARRGDLQHGLWRLASHPYALAGAMTGMGFVAVFIAQMPILYQLVFGAPVFEELVKFGLALLLSLPLRLRVLRVPVAFAVGAGFGALEHWSTYGEEGTALYVGRILFHGGAAALSMASYHALQTAVDPRARLASTLPSTVIHYLNNAGALATLPLYAVSETTGAAVGIAWSGLLVLSLYGALVAMLVAGGRYRARVVRWWWRRQPLGASWAARRS